MHRFIVQFIGKSLIHKLRLVLLFLHQIVYGEPLLERHRLQAPKMLATATTTSHEHSNLLQIDVHMPLAVEKITNKFNQFFFSRNENLR